MILYQSGYSSQKSISSKSPLPNFEKLVGQSYPFSYQDLEDPDKKNVLGMIGTLESVEPLKDKKGMIIGYIPVIRIKENAPIGERWHGLQNCFSHCITTVIENLKNENEIDFFCIKVINDLHIPKSEALLHQVKNYIQNGENDDPIEENYFPIKQSDHTFFYLRQEDWRHDENFGKTRPAIKKPLEKILTHAPVFLKKGDFLPALSSSPDLPLVWLEYEEEHPPIHPQLKELCAAAHQSAIVDELAQTVTQSEKYAVFNVFFQDPQNKDTLIHVGTFYVNKKEEESDNFFNFYPEKDALYPLINPLLGESTTHLMKDAVEGICQETYTGFYGPILKDAKSENASHSAMLEPLGFLDDRSTEKDVKSLKRQLDHSSLEDNGPEEANGPKKKVHTLGEEPQQ